MQLSDPRQIQRSVQPITLLELFLRGKGIVTGLSMLNLQFKKLADQQWQNTLVPLVKIIGQLVYPFLNIRMEDDENEFIKILTFSLT